MDAYIKAISYHLPERIIDNPSIVEEFSEWTVEKIDKKLGIKERHVVSKGECASDIAYAAAKQLFNEYEIDRNEIDCLILCTQSPDYILPTTACLLQNKLNLSKNICAFDINLGCSGWVYGLAIAKSFVISGLCKNVLLLTAETYSIYMHPKDKGNRTIFGDGSAATLVSDNGIAKIGEFNMGTDGAGYKNLIVRTGASRHRESLNDLTFDDFGNPKSSDYLYMDGSEILNYTLERIPLIVQDVLKKNNMDIENIDIHIYHQANKYIADLQRRKLKIKPERYYHSYEMTGNTVSSTIPIAIYEALKDGSIKKGYKVLSVAQGLGYSWGGVLLNF